MLHFVQHDSDLSDNTVFARNEVTKQSVNAANTIRLLRLARNDALFFRILGQTDNREFGRRRYSSQVICSGMEGNRRSSWLGLTRTAKPN